MLILIQRGRDPFWLLVSVHPAMYFVVVLFAKGRRARFGRRWYSGIKLHQRMVVSRLFESASIFHFMRNVPKVITHTHREQQLAVTVIPRSPQMAKEDPKGKAVLHTFPIPPARLSDIGWRKPASDHKSAVL